MAHLLKLPHIHCLGTPGNAHFPCQKAQPHTGFMATTTREDGPCHYSMLPKHAVKAVAMPAFHACCLMHVSCIIHHATCCCCSATTCSQRRERRQRDEMLPPCHAAACCYSYMPCLFACLIWHASSLSFFFCHYQRLEHTPGALSCMPHTTHTYTQCLSAWAKV